MERYLLISYFLFVIGKNSWRQLRMSNELREVSSDNLQTV